MPIALLNNICTTLYMVNAVKLTIYEIITWRNSKLLSTILGILVNK